MIYEPVKFQADREMLAGCWVRAEQGAVPTILFLHGAGQADKNRARPLAEYMATQYGVSSFLFDFSGHGESSGALQNSSLFKRAREAEAAVLTAGFNPGFSICAFSMGGHVALTLIERFQILSINLFYPAVYPLAAEDLTFGEAFSAAIRQDGEWRRSPRFDSLGRFKGALLIAIGDQDEVIPRDLPQRLVDAARNARRKEIVIVPGGTHALLPTIFESKELIEEIASKVTANAFTPPRQSA